MLIKIRDNDGKIFSTDPTDPCGIVTIHIGTSYTTFETQEETFTEDGTRTYLRKDVIVPVEGKDDLTTALDFIAISAEDIGEIVEG